MTETIVDELSRADEAFAGNRLLSTFSREARGLIEDHGETIEVSSGEVVLTADSCYMRKALNEMLFPPFADDYDAMRTVMERYRAMERAGARLIFGHDPGQWRDDGTLADSLR